MIAVCFGTRPEIIKMAPVIHVLEDRGIDHETIHSGQHYSPEMSGNFFEELDLHNPTHDLGVGSGRAASQLAEIIRRAGTMMAGRYSLALVHGDTNTTLGCALAANKSRIPIGHVEAGLRCGDMSMPEECNRVMVDHISTLLFPPTMQARENIMFENLNGPRFRHPVVVTGNTIVDAVQMIDPKVPELQDRYILLTLHRQENVDNPERLSDILSALQDVRTEIGLPIVFPCHPRTRDKVDGNGSLQVMGPAGYWDFLRLEAASRLTITDSGGVVEECCIQNVPTVILRNCTERPEALSCGAAMLAYPEGLVLASQYMLKKSRDWSHPYGDGHAAERIVNQVERAGYT
jgi:UDP-N-acetylglucosamine 2-epimerase (non-hydrolysing)